MSAVFLVTGAGGVEHGMASQNIYYKAQTTNMHNWWMKILTGYGIFIFAGYLRFYLYLRCDMFKIYKLTYTKLHKKAIFSSIFPFLMSYIISSLSSSTNMANQRIWVFFALAMVFLGISSSFSRYNKS